MKFPRAKIIGEIFVVVSLIGFGYVFRGDMARLANDAMDRLKPCRRPIEYSIGDLDPKFDLSQEELLESVFRAEEVWETPIGKELFEHSPDGELRINLIYDYRQKATDAMRKLGIAMNDDKATYDALKAKYDSLIASYEGEKKRIASLVAEYEADMSALNKDVKYWNRRGGAPKEEYEALIERQAGLDARVATINDAKEKLNSLADTINSTTVVLNKLVEELNINADAYNSIGESTGKEFGEGEYIRDATGTVINIFQFENRDKLFRVLAHELGHALGLEHLDDPDAMMYRLNESGNETLTEDDLAALRARCGIDRTVE